MIFNKPVRIFPVDIQIVSFKICVSSVLFFKEFLNSIFIICRKVSVFKGQTIHRPFNHYKTAIIYVFQWFVGLELNTSPFAFFWYN